MSTSLPTAQRASLLATVVLAAALASCANAGPGAGPAASPASPATAYLPRAHSHNDYAQPQPLAEALARGFASIEVDVVLRNGELYVAHGPDEVRQGVTLERLYLEPLRAHVRRNGGTVYGASDPPLLLLIDVKSDAVATHAALHEALSAYDDIVASWTRAGRGPGAIFVVLSGNRAFEPIRDQPVRYVAIDGRVLDDRAGVGADAMPLVSIDWETVGPPDHGERLRRARALVEELHAEGRQVRFWGTPEDEALWSELLALGVDYIGTDEPRRLERLLRDRGEEPTRAVD